VKKVSFADMQCSVAQALEVIGEWWTLLILRDAFLGVTRFDDFASRLGISRNVLTARLDTLVDNDVLTRVPYDEARGRYDYRLTDKGRALFPVMTALREWGDEWILGKGHEPVVVEHTACGHLARSVLTCDHCHEALTTRNVRARRGPGATTDLVPSA
jgi:DNA-binding HxlR family transcriptional regulator